MPLTLNNTASHVAGVLTVFHLSRIKSGTKTSDFLAEISFSVVCFLFEMDFFCCILLYLFIVAEDDHMYS